MIDHYWYPFYPTKYKSKTMHLTAEQDGVYRRLLDHYMETKECLPNNIGALARIAGVDIKCMTDAWGELSTFFDEEDGKLFSTTCSEILEEQNKRDKSRSKAGKKAAASRWSKKKKPIMRDVCDSDANAMRFDATGQDRTGQDSKKEKSNKKEKVSLSDLSISHVEDWLTKKRVGGKYLTIDEHRLLEKFKDYCTSKGKTYSNYVAGFRNAFEWQNAPTKGNTNGKYTASDALGEVLTEIRADSANGGAVLCSTEHIRENPTPIENFNEGYDNGFARLPTGRD